MRRIPVTILAGFLGAGKTTLLNRILREGRGQRIAVIENEFGEIGIDDRLVEAAAPSREAIFTMSAGCICCTVRGDLVRVLGDLPCERFDRVLVETTGLADPARVVRSFILNEDIAAKMYIDAVVTTVDAEHVHLHLDEIRECARQVAFADLILLNKIDLVSPADVDNLEMRIRGINPVARLRRTLHGDVETGLLLDLRAFDLRRALARDPTFLDGDPGSDDGARAGRPFRGPSRDASRDPSREHSRHGDGVVSVGIELRGDLDGDKFQRWVKDLLQSRGRDIFRMKGILDMKGASRPFILQGVHMRLDCVQERAPNARTASSTSNAPAASNVPAAPNASSARLVTGPGRRERGNKLVLIGRNLDRDAIQGGLRACLA
ncbi:CobW family GTP-binding protein [Pendulispora albinea]|uniref:GTP-binding protein n=1 Tax=Pendulispora albinea TaxID=2741071 RepID=A0ABZ2M9F9_9BACT